MIRSRLRPCTYRTGEEPQALLRSIRVQWACLRPFETELASSDASSSAQVSAIPQPSTEPLSDHCLFVFWFRLPVRYPLLPSGRCKLQSARTAHQVRIARRGSIYERSLDDGGGRLKRLSSKRTLCVAGSAGAIRRYELGDRETSKQISGGTQLAASLARRCRFASGVACPCTVFTVGAETSQGEQ